MSSDSVVYILEDDPGVVDSVSLLLRVSGMRFEVFTRVDEFLSRMEFADWNFENVSCLLLDLRLPGDGMTVLRYFSEQQISLPTIVMTGHGDEELRARALNLGAHGFVEKPFDAQELLDLIEDARPEANANRSAT